MKSYIQGLITGGVFVFAIMVLMGFNEPPTTYGNSCDEDKIIERILYCIDGGSVGDQHISTFCNR